MNYVDQELSIEDMLADPIVQTLMRYDGISASDVRHTIEQVNQNRTALAKGVTPGSSHHNRLHWRTADATDTRLHHKAA
ncbi:hypothetical protein [Thalassospira aquimaris]|uniref:Uncharacterized protein n=2 Tax=Thalassospira TaxID=168934 RepID=A0A367W1P0_9PROT|nr:hypothetical protein [Thalassospira sp. FZY0004]RCK31730.1 hypothetical protein TH19_20875 [Thalassospira profundimaris]